MADAERLLVPCEIREDASRESPGRLFGTLMRYDEPSLGVTKTRDGRFMRPGGEVFKAGALTWPEDGIVVNVMHDKTQAVLKAIPETRGTEVVIDAMLPNTGKGRDLATDIRGGLYEGFSVEFHADRTRMSAGRREIQSARLVDVGVVGKPAYPDTRVEVREQSDEDFVDMLREGLHLL